jgi:trk system potassium uptake protein TrkH
MKLAIKKRFLQYISILTAIASIAAFVSLLLYYGFYMPDKWVIGLFILDEIIAGIFVINLITSFILSQDKWQFVKDSPFEIFLFLLFIFSITIEEIISVENPHYLLRTSTSYNFIKLYFLIIQIYIFINALITLTRTREKLHLLKMSPSRIIMLSYIVVILFGSLLLKLPRATYAPISWMDSLFTSASAICVTGLSTVNISQVFTFEGQLFILLLIQLGGLGIVTLTSSIALFVFRGIRLRDQIMVNEIFNSQNFSSLAAIVKTIILFTFTTELVGAIGLYFAWGNLDLSEFDRIFSAIFHSVSAYCNAGFSIFPQGFQTTSYNFTPISLVIIMIVIICGGIGFYTFSDIMGIGEKDMIEKNGLTPQSKIILISTFILIVVGAFLIWILQYKQWNSLPFGKQVLNAFFLSIASRTAGFSIAEIRNIAIPTAMVIIMLMYIGAAPNSTAGGIKITSGVILLNSFAAFVKGKNRVEVGWNTIPMITVRKAYIVFIASIILIFISSFILSLTEGSSFFDNFFEIISAFGTVGLSRGITSGLSELSKIVLIFVMLAGKIGLFTLAVAVSEEAEGTAYHFPEINLMI